MHLVGDLLVRLGADEGVCLVEVIEDEWDFDGVTCPDVGDRAAVPELVEVRRARWTRRGERSRRAGECACGERLREHVAWAGTGVESGAELVDAIRLPTEYLSLIHI